MKPLADNLCEARVVTYRRPQWLRRALLSLIAQTHGNWTAIVMDDSPDREAEAVVRDLADPRINYRANARRLGAAGNLDQAFATGPISGGSHAFILEDDNWLSPTFIEQNLGLMHEAGVNLVLRNQRIWAQRGEAFHDTGRTTRGDWFRDGIHPVLSLRARLFFMEGVSNGGLFWSTGATSRLQVGDSVSAAGVQEWCRTLGVREPLLFCAEPLAVWADLEPASVSREARDDRHYARSVQSIRRALWRLHGRAITDEAIRLAHNLNADASSGFCDLFPRLPAPWKPGSLKALSRLLTMRDPLRTYWRRNPLS